MPPIQESAEAMPLERPVAEASAGAALEDAVGAEVTRLGARTTEFVPLLDALRAAGPVTTRVVNAAAVHETTGPIGEVAAHGAMGQVVGKIDLRLFLNHWHAAYGLTGASGEGLLRVVDGAGEPVVDISTTAMTDREAWERVIGAHRAPDSAVPTFAPHAPPAPETPDAEIDVAGLRSAWATLDHTHDFYGILRRFGVGREQALRLGGADFAVEVPPTILRTVFWAAERAGVQIMCFVGSRGCLQIYTGPVTLTPGQAEPTRIRGDGFTLSLDAARIARCWVVIKPTKLRGRITSIEVFDTAGTQVCQLFGARPPGEQENPAWRDIVEQAAAEVAQ
ncbi:MAG: ChuX/HutX family heme-like substrate-binding protein [Pseudomonadota bacterium]